MTKMTADVMVADAAALYKVWWQNHQRSFRQEGSCYVPADFQANKSHVIVPGPVFVKGQRNRLIPGLLMVAKASRRCARLPIH
jgi:hypothetical protein